MDPTNPEVAESTRRRSGYNALKTIHKFSRTMSLSMYSAHRDSEPKELEDPKDAEELSEWSKNQDARRKHDYQDGFFFDLPERETSFDDSMHLAIFLAENGHYTQSMVLLRVALNTILTNAMKEIVVAIPSRIEESKFLTAMFHRKTDDANLSMSREGVWDRRALTREKHNIPIPKALGELGHSKIISGQQAWWRRLQVTTLNSHVHALDKVVDRYRIEPFETERRFSDELWGEFESIALAVLDLKLCITRGFNKKALDLRFKGYISKDVKRQLKFFDVSQYVPVFSSNLPPGALTRCTKCKMKPLSNSKQKDGDFVCGECHKSKKLPESAGS